MFVRKDYSIIALAETLKRGGDQRKARFERSLSGMTLELMPTADRGPGEAIPSVSFARDLELGSQAGVKQLLAAVFCRLQQQQDRKPSWKQVAQLWWI